MRELKFRAWHKTLKEMLEITAIDFDRREVEYIYDDYANAEQTKEWASFEDIELEQYTGFNDKIGMPIFEGDIIERIWKEHTYVRAYSEVVFKNGTWVYTFENEDYDSNSLASILDDYYILVIGNIHKNKELLK